MLEWPKENFCTVSGPLNAIQQLENDLANKDIACKRVKIAFAGHSPMQESILPEFRRRLQQVPFAPPTLPFISNVTGTWIRPEEAMDPAYWVRHLRQTVRFAQGLDELLQEPNRLFLEVGPGQTLQPLVRGHTSKTDSHATVTSLRHPKALFSDVQYLLQSVGTLWLNGDGTFFVNNDLLQFRRPNFDRLLAQFGPIDRLDAPGQSQKGRDIAATLQSVTNDILLALATHLHAQHPCDALCMAGGVVLNCTSNWFVKEQGPYQQIYIPSAPNDAGTAVGAALYHYYTQSVHTPVHNGTGHAMINNGASRPPSVRTVEVMPHPYTGPSFDDADFLQLLEKQQRPYRKSANVAQEAATLIAGGKIVAWFQGAMELGPRALGNRSLLADPRNANMREVLNRKVKHREIFRPFAPSVLEEYAAEWFEIGKFSESYRYMLYACPVHEEKINRIPAVVHVDDTARIQTVARETNPKYHQLISHFYQLTGVPLVLNTSFNDSEPIVCTPQDALNTFNKTQIDVLILGDYIVERDLVVSLNGHGKLHTRTGTQLEAVPAADQKKRNK